MRVIDYQKVDITDEEFTYYKELVTQTTDDKIKGEDFFRDLFKTDEDGFITIITPKKSIPWAILFFVQQVMINQRLRYIDRLRKEKPNVG